MAQDGQGLPEIAAAVAAREASGAAPEASENLPNRFERLLRRIQLIGWALPDSPELLAVTDRAFRVPR